MSRTIALGVDLATADARVVAIDVESGATLHTESAALADVTEPGDGRREQAATHAAVVDVLLARTVAALGADAVGIRAVSVTGTSGSVAPVDARGRAVGPAVLYDDRRAAALERELAERMPARPVGALARLVALHREHPATGYASTADLVASALLGTRADGDTSHWLKAGIDPAARCWPADLLDELGVPLGALPDLVPPGAVLGEVAGGPLPAGVIVVAGMTDGCTSQLATGTVAPGGTVGVLGTTLVLKAVARDELSMPESGVYSHLAPDGAWWAGGASNVGAGALAPGGDKAALDLAADAAGPSAVVGYPLPRRGERFPFASPDAEAFWLALDGAPREPAGALEHHRAVLEGVALVERLGLETLAARGAGGGPHVLSGGATRSAVWNGIRAAALGRTVTVPAHATSGRGAAVLAAWGLLGGWEADGGFAALAARLAGRGTTIDPDAALAAALDDRAAVLVGELRRRGLLPA